MILFLSDLLQTFKACIMKKFLPFFLILATPAILVNGQDCSELFFSEYVEGSGNNKALEIYNPTDQIVDLGKYFVARYSNGSSSYTAGGFTQLEGFLPAHTAFVLVNGQTEDTDLGGGNISPKCDPALQALADQLDHAYPAPTYMNGNDAIALLKSDDKNIDNAIAVDLIGQIGLGSAISSETGWSFVKDTTVEYRVDSVNNIYTKGKVINYIVQANDTTGQYFGPYWLAWTKDHTLIRKVTVTKGVTDNPDPFVVTMEWDTASSEKDFWDSLGTHFSNCDIATAVNQPLARPAQVVVYPNPVTGGNMEIITNYTIRHIEITNILGEILISLETLGEIRRQVSISLPPDIHGMVFAKVSMEGNRTEVRKIMIR
ncbi:MAG: T9SS type A sorting domain-containing protein [Chlorobi bacterium]|nr:T9SS type A sorting domain-containing protein [Chlorobiota bacterium]